MAYQHKNTDTSLRFCFTNNNKKVFKFIQILHTENRRATQAKNKHFLLHILPKSLLPTRPTFQQRTYCGMNTQFTKQNIPSRHAVYTQTTEGKKKKKIGKDPLYINTTWQCYLAYFCWFDCYLIKLKSITITSG